MRAGGEPPDRPVVIGTLWGRMIGWLGKSIDQNCFTKDCVIRTFGFIGLMRMARYITPLVLYKPSFLQMQQSTMEVNTGANKKKTPTEVGAFSERFSGKGRGMNKTPKP